MSGRDTPMPSTPYELAAWLVARGRGDDLVVIPADTEPMPAGAQQGDDLVAMSAIDLLRHLVDLHDAYHEEEATVADPEVERRALREHLEGTGFGLVGAVHYPNGSVSWHVRWVDKE